MLTEFLEFFSGSTVEAVIKEYLVNWNAKTDDPSDAVDMLTEQNIKPNLDHQAQQHATRNQWRHQRLYTQEVRDGRACSESSAACVSLVRSHRPCR